MSIVPELTEEQVQAFLADLLVACGKHKIGLRGLSAFDAVWLAPLPRDHTVVCGAIYDDGLWRLTWRDVSRHEERR